MGLARLRATNQESIPVYVDGDFVIDDLHHDAQLLDAVADVLQRAGLPLDGLRVGGVLDAAHELLELGHVSRVIPRLDVQDHLGHGDDDLQLARRGLLGLVRRGDRREALLVLLLGLLVLVAPQVILAGVLLLLRSGGGSRSRSVGRAELGGVGAGERGLLGGAVGVDQAQEALDVRELVRDAGAGRIVRGDVRLRRSVAVEAAPVST